MKNDKKKGESEAEKRRRVIKELSPYATLGIELVLAILFCAYGGYWLDKQFDSSPVFLLILTFLGAAAGMVNFIKTATKKNGK